MELMNSDSQNTKLVVLLMLVLEIILIGNFQEDFLSIFFVICTTTRKSAFKKIIGQSNDVDMAEWHYVELSFLEIWV